MFGRDKRARLPCSSYRIMANQEYYSNDLEHLRSILLNQIDASAQDPASVNHRDVVCNTRDERCAQHLGNRYLAVLVAEAFAQREDGLEGLRDDVQLRRSIAGSITRNIHDMGGRFLGKTVRGTYKQLGESLSIRWVSHIISRAADQADGTEQPAAFGYLFEPE